MLRKLRLLTVQTSLSLVFTRAPQYIICCYGASAFRSCRLDFPGRFRFGLDVFAIFLFCTDYSITKAFCKKVFCLPDFWDFKKYFLTAVAKKRFAD